MSRYVVNAIDGKLLYSSDAYHVLFDVRGTTPLYGYIPANEDLVSRMLFWDKIYHRFVEVLVYIKNFEGRYIVSSFTDKKLYREGIPEEILFQHRNRLGINLYPYDFHREYEAINHFDIFKGNQQILNMRKFKLSHYIKYTFGLEFETSLGAIPEKICFRDGLIPLRDGSITGVEYSTIVLKRNPGLSLLEQQINTLKEYTVFNKDCSLHVHIGGFPLIPDVIFRIYQTCYLLENEIQTLIPEYSFQTCRYKTNGKDYCKKLKVFSSFDEMYYSLVGISYKGRLDIPHPRDVDRGHKWMISSRYYWLNVINALCYSVNKTVEFRFLRPTYNFRKILLWLYIFGAIVKFAKDSAYIDMYSKLDLKTVLKRVYPPDLVKSLMDGINRLRIVTQMQHDNGDLIGEQTVFEDRLFKGNEDW